MRKLNLYLAMAAMACLVSCTSTDDTVPPMPGQQQSNVINFAPAKKTEIAFTSNDIDIAQNAIVTWATITTTAIDRAAEQTLCGEVLAESQNNTDILDKDFLFYAKDGDVEMEFYPVYSQTSQHHKLGLFYYDAEGNRHDQIIWEGIDPYHLYTSEWKWTAEKGSYEVQTSKGVKVTVKKGYKFGFYWDGIYTPEGKYTPESTTFYSSTGLNPDGKPHAGTFVRNNKTYLGIEDWTDYDYQDLVFTCDKELVTVEPDDIKPTPDVPVEPVEPVDPIDPEEPTTPEDPAEPVIKAMGGSVEVNLALNDEHENGDWKESHLSVHVRDTTDFTIFIPVKAEYYCPQDDMMIVQKHDTKYVYNNTNETLSMVVNRQTVTLNVTFAENGITFTSHGINADVLKYCREIYGDGITFEVRNYYNDKLDRTQLKEILSQSTISFTNAPAVYLYAYGIWNGVIDPLACAVKPTDADEREAEDTFIGETTSAELHVFKKK